jgi:TPR repeat protein
MEIQEEEMRAAGLLERRQFHEAQKLLSALSDQGSIYSLMALGWIHEGGFLGQRDVAAAATCYERAAMCGHHTAFSYWGFLLLKEGKQSEARRVFEKGAEKGHAASLSELGWMLVKGARGPVQRDEGVRLLRDAAQAGHFFAERRLITIELSEGTSICRRIALSFRIMILVLKAFFEVIRDRESAKLW